MPTILQSSFLCLFLLSACPLLEKPTEKARRLRAEREAEAEFSFFIAGHTYGFEYDVAFYPPFRAKIPTIAADKSIQLGFILGDTVRKATLKEWDAVDRAFATLQRPVYLVFGNHDYLKADADAEHIDLEGMKKRYGRDTFYSTSFRDVLFVMLDTYRTKWNVEGEQLAFLQRTIQERSPNIKRVFIFSHHLVWWEKGNIFGEYLSPNSLASRNADNNYWRDVEPFLQGLEIPVTWVAGDVGAIPTRQSIGIHQDKNISYLGTGMGSGKKGNFLIARVMRDGQLFFDVVSLDTEDPQAMGVIEDYVLGKN